MLTWKVAEFIHELLLHVLEVMARVVLRVRVLVVLMVLSVLSVRVLVMGGFCPFLRLRFGRLGSPPDPEAVSGQPHDGCEDGGGSMAVVINSALAPERDDPSVGLYACNPCVHAVHFQSTAHL